MNFIFSFIAVFLLVNQSNNVELKVEMSKKKAIEFKDLAIKMSIINSQTKHLVVNKYMDLGYSIDPGTEIYFDLEKLTNSKYKAIEGSAFIDPVPRIDSLGNSEDYLFDTIPPKTTVVKSYNLTEIYSGISKGNYRVRVNFRMPRINVVQSKELQSNWVYFSVKVNKIYFKFN